MINKLFFSLISLHKTNYRHLKIPTLGIFSAAISFVKNSVFIFLIINSSISYASDDFPGRTLYPEVTVISLASLYEERDAVVIIDTRSPYEFQTLKIKNALSVPLVLSSKKFKDAMHSIRAEHPDKKIVFYCNGHTCMKSYKAVRRTTHYLKMSNVYAYDAGIFTWAQKYPHDTVLLGHILSDPEKLIDKASFKKHLLGAEKFIKQADESTIILDIRDRIERDGFYVFSGYEKSISLNANESKKMSKFIDMVKRSNKTLYIYDMVGKQVKWYQYYLEKKGITEYYFMQGGAEAFFKIPLKNLMD